MILLKSLVGQVAQRAEDCLDPRAATRANGSKGQLVAENVEDALPEPLPGERVCTKHEMTHLETLDSRRL